MKDQNKKQLTEVARNISTSESSIRTFRSQVDFYVTKIKRGKDSLPRLRAEIRNIEEGLPLWHDEVRMYELSIDTHERRLGEQKHREVLLTEKERILSKLKKLDNSMR